MELKPCMASVITSNILVDTEVMSNTKSQWTKKLELIEMERDSLTKGVWEAGEDYLWSEDNEKKKSVWY